MIPAVPTRAQSLTTLAARIESCRSCPRLIDHCRQVARVRRRAYADWDYWGKPVPGFGDRNAWLWIIGLAPGAHGANRTGRVFTGDRSGDFLYAALHRAGWCNQPESTSVDDGLRLCGVFISAAARCAPPGNRPTPAELANCAGFLSEEWMLLSRVRVILALGSIAWTAAKSLAASHGAAGIDGKRAFCHGAHLRLDARRHMFGSYHVSQQNTFTGKLTAAMFDSVLRKCHAVMSSDD